MGGVGGVLEHCIDEVVFIAEEASAWCPGSFIYARRKGVRLTCLSRL